VSACISADRHVDNHTVRVQCERVNTEASPHRVPKRPKRPRSDRVARAFITVVMVVVCLKVLIDPDIDVTTRMLFPVVMAVAWWWRVRWRAD
jgi:hypothetical protein